MNSKHTGIFAALIASVLLLAGLASAASVDFTNVEVDGVEVFTSSTNRLDVVRGGTMDVRVEFDSNANLSNVELSAELDGYEYADIEASAPLFDVEADVTYVKRLALELPDDLEEGDYLLRVSVRDRASFSMLKEYKLKIDVQRHELVVKDVVFTPENQVKAGSALLATVRVENMGEKDEDDAKVTVAVPQLGASGSTYLDVDAGDQEGTEEVFIRVPRCAKAGQYEVRTTVEYNRGHDSATATDTINVVEDESCSAVAPLAPAPVVVSAPAAPAAPETSGVRNALEIALLVLVGLLVVIGLIVGFSKLRGSED